MELFMALALIFLVIVFFKQIIGISLLGIMAFLGYKVYKDPARFKNLSKGKKIASIMLSFILIGGGFNLISASSTDKTKDIQKNNSDIQKIVKEDESDLGLSKEKSIEVKKELPNNNFEKATVTKHVDGDTVHVTLEDGSIHKIRMIGVDTPETVHPNKPIEFFGKEASNFTKEKLLNQTVYLEKDVSDTDKYGRLLRYIWLDIPSVINETTIRANMFNAMLLTNGYAQISTYPPDVKYQNTFLEFSQEARDNNTGLWANEYTDKQVQQSTNSSGSSSTEVESVEEEQPAPLSVSENVYVTPTGSKYHSKKCGKGNFSETTLDNAKSRGLTPCKKCY